MRMLRGAICAMAAGAALLTPVLPAGAKPATTTATTVTVTAGKPSEFAFTLSTSSVPAGVVTFNVTNEGAIIHDFSIAGKKTKNLQPGESQSITVNLAKGGSVAYLCTVTGHAAAGMKGTLQVTGGAPAVLKLAAVLNVGQEVPAPKGTRLGASGRFTATLDGQSLQWRLTFSRLSGQATASHIHLGIRGKAGPVLKPLCGPCSAPRTGTATLTASQATAMKNGRTYVNVHTAKNPNGEIRGQIRRAPAM